MSQKEARRPGLVQAALDGKITNEEGAKALRLSVRQFQRLKVRYRVGGAARLAHANRGRPSGRRMPRALRDRVVMLLKTVYAGFNDHHFTEKLREVEGLALSRELVRRLRREAQIPPARRRRPVKYRARRLREGRQGALVLLDGSEFAWFGERHRICTLLGAIDDATGQILALHFRPNEDLHGYTELLRRIACSHGVPVQLYGDRLNVFVRNDEHWTLEEQLAGIRTPTQFGSMLAELAIGYIPAGSPQAKGRIERLWQTLQDRLAAELRLHHRRTMAQGEAFLEHFIPDFNRRFTTAPRSGDPAWRRPPRHLDSILACRYERRVARDNTVTIAGRWTQIPPGPGKRSYQGCRVQVREQLNGQLLVLYQNRIIAHQPAPSGAFTLLPRKSARVKRRTALGLQNPKRQRARPEPGPPPPRIQRSHPNPPNHPWKNYDAVMRNKTPARG